MGLRDALKRSKADVDLTVEPRDVLPGDDVRLRITISGELDEKTQGARAGLRCVHRYLVRERDHHDDDRPGDVDEVWRSMVLHEEVHDLAAEPGTVEVVCTVPPGAAPTSADAVEWTAFALLDRRKALDVNDGEPVRVGSTAEVLPAELPPPPPGEGGLRIAELPARVQAGGTLEGVLEYTPEDDLKATGVVVRLTRVRTYSAKVLDQHDPDRIARFDLGRFGLDWHEDGGITIGKNSSRIVKREEVAEVEVAGKQEFPGGQTARIPFAVPVPADAGPTVVVPHAVVEWQVKATVQRRLRGDHDAVAVVGVHTAP